MQNIWRVNMSETTTVDYGIRQPADKTQPTHYVNNAGFHSALVQYKEQRDAAIAEGKRKVAVARADSAETIINAQAAALAIKIKQTQLSPLYIEYIKAQAWDGKLPKTVAGGSGTFLNIKN